MCELNSIKMESFLPQNVQHKQSKTTGTQRENIFQKLIYGLKCKLTTHIYVNQKINKLSPLRVKIYASFVEFLLLSNEKKPHIGIKKYAYGS